MGVLSSQICDTLNNGKQESHKVAQNCGITLRSHYRAVGLAMESSIAR